jgi:hypothetical protein
VLKLAFNRWGSTAPDTGPRLDPAVGG